MAKKFGKFLMTAAALGAVAAGAYYFVMKKDEFLDDDFDDDDFDDFDEDLDDDGADRKYVDLDLTKTAEEVEEKTDDFKEGLNAAKAEATDKIVGETKEAAEAVNKVEEDVEEYFDDEDEDFEDDNYTSLESM